MRLHTWDVVFGAVALVATVAGAVAADGWAKFNDETAARSIVAAQLFASDGEEKDYAWADIDKDGDIDLLIVRKEPATTPGRRRNLLLMNEGIADGHAMNGVLVDRTVEFMTDADDGGQGFLDLTNDRDVVLADVNQDGWLDAITAPAYGQGLPKTISHGRIYINQGEVGGAWQGFKYEEGRMPTLVDAPNVNAVGAADVNGDGYPDLFYVTYDSDTLEDHLLINDGTGHFTNESNRVNSTFLESIFGSAAYIVDMNNDGFNDLLKAEAGLVETAYNDGTGFFTQWEVTSAAAHYFVSPGDLNNDGKLDLIISDDGSDRYRINQGPGGDGMANFADNTFSFSGGGFDDGFGGNSVTADLNNDGFNDVVLGDFDVQQPGCERRTHIYRNLGNLPVPTLQEQQQDGSVVNIPISKLSGTHDIAVFDLNGDGWNDMVIGRCSGTEIWINEPPQGLVFTYPVGLPVYVEPGATTTFQVKLAAFGGGEPEENSAKLHYAVGGDDFTTVDLVFLGNDLYEATLPAIDCAQTIDFYLSGKLDDGSTFADPSGAPQQTYQAIGAAGTEVTFIDDIEGDVSGWTIENDPSLAAGAWEAADPNGTLTVQGAQAAPDDDAGADPDIMAFVTENGVPGQSAGLSDVDGGPTFLISPPIDLEGTDAVISYARWFFNDDVDTPQMDHLFVEVSNDDGANWVQVEQVASTGSAWQVASFKVGEFLTPTADVRVRFWTNDTPNNSVTEAGVDNFQVEELVCGGPCTGDFDGSGGVDGADLGLLLGAWGSANEDFDLDGDGTVDGADLGLLLGAWGDCG